MFKLIKLKVLEDNYVWILIQDNKCVIIDPGVYLPVLNFLEDEKIFPIAILITHKHIDHIGGVCYLKTRYPNLKVFAPKEVLIKEIFHLESKHQFLKIDCFSFEVFFTPGHTKYHVSYYCEPYLFCGDVLFSGGCGRIFDGTFDEMFYSVNLIKSFPNETVLCSAHDYVVQNMKFSYFYFKNDKDIMDYFKFILYKNKFYFPSTIKLEKKINVFFKLNNYLIKKNLNLLNHSEFVIFCKLRHLKDKFKNF